MSRCIAVTTSPCSADFTRQSAAIFRCNIGAYIVDFIIFCARIFQILISLLPCTVSSRFFLCFAILLNQVECRDTASRKIETLDKLSVCILYNTASFLRQHDFFEFVLVSRSIIGAYLLPTNIMTAKPSTLKAYKKWRNSKENVKFDSKRNLQFLAKVELRLMCVSDDDLTNFKCIKKNMRFNKLVLEVDDRSFSGHSLVNLGSLAQLDKFRLAGTA